MASSSRNNVFEFKISLKYLKPPIWRRIQVPANYTFQQLHWAIQDCMDWKSKFYNYHLHAFRMEVNGKRIEIGISERENHLYDFMETISEKRAHLKDYFIEPKTKALYEYDFGESWEHDVVLEKVLPALDGTAYPKCIAGRRACPLEDCGGYYEDEDERPEPKEFDRNSVIFHEGDKTKEIK